MSDKRREPSIHVSESDLSLILSKMREEGHLETDLDINELSFKILSMAKKHSLSHRLMVATNQKMRSKKEGISSSSIGDTYEMAKVLYSVRIKKKHRGVRQINESDRDWPVLKKITKNAIDFCHDFEMDYKEGFTDYIMIAFDKMNKFALNKILGMHEAIVEHKDALEEINSDTNQNNTKELYEAYINKIHQRTGMSIDYYGDPAQYINFVRASKMISKHEIRPVDFVESQFESFSYREGVPYPAQLLGDKAINRFIKYAYENKISMGENPSKPSIDFNQIKTDG